LINRISPAGQIFAFETATRYIAPARNVVSNSCRLGLVIIPRIAKTLYLRGFFAGKKRAALVAGLH
jgi:hypothetical protein